MALDHIGFDAKNYEAAVSFYEKVLTPLGNQKKMTIDHESGRATGFGKCEILLTL